MDCENEKKTENREPIILFATADKTNPRSWMLKGPPSNNILRKTDVTLPANWDFIPLNAVWYGFLHLISILFASSAPMASAKKTNVTSENWWPSFPIIIRTNQKKFCEKHLDARWKLKSYLLEGIYKDSTMIIIIFINLQSFQQDRKGA